MQKKRHISKTIKLDNCALLQDLEVRVPEEILYLEGKLKAVLKDIEAFYARFFGMEGFIKDLTVKFHLKNLLSKDGDFNCCDARTEKPVINIFNTVDKVCNGIIDEVIAHEFAHFIAWKLAKLEGYSCDISERKGTVEKGLALKYLSLQEVKPSGFPSGGPSAYSLNQPCELFARYVEQYYKYCFHHEEATRIKKRKVKNSLYIRNEDFEKDLLEPIRDYIGYTYQPSNQKDEPVMYEGNLYSSDKKTLLKYMNQKNSDEFVVPDFVEVIGKEAFANCTSIVSIHIGTGVKEIETMAFAYCSSLKLVSGGENVRFISSSVFLQCTALEEINGFDNLEIIGSMGFIKCSLLKKYPEMKKLKYIGSLAFFNDRLIVPEDFTEKVSYIGTHAFSTTKKNEGVLDNQKAETPESN
ncbi:MAG: leucine-rich repeat domain-containing protein [Treponema sp.]|nr:leucine-rich repeat domain-containing protein [Treponema sp.]